MATWGVDIGVRSAYAVSGDSHAVIQLKPRKHSRSEELRLLHSWAMETFAVGDIAYIEEPPLAGRRNLRVFLQLAQASGAVGSACDAEFVPVSSWKKGTVGNGAANKDQVADWLRHAHPRRHARCGGDQNLIDATCIWLHASMDQR